jgi:hypothetical protein
MSKQLQRVLGLARRTGDRVVVFDPESDNSYVVIGLDEYEALVASKRQITPDIKPPAASEAKPQAPAVSSLTDGVNSDKMNRDAGMWKNQNNFRNSDENQEKRPNNWQIPPTVKNNAEEVKE